VTGGAGFIGSHLVDRLTSLGAEVVVFDNLSTGTLDNLRKAEGLRDLKFVRDDLLDGDAIARSLGRCSLVFHLAANPEVRIGVSNSRIDFEQNLVATHNLLEAMKMSKCAKTIVFASTSTVYGEAKIPTPEDYSPMIPISLYGASKLGCEALIMAYCHLFNMRAVIYRFANVVGSRSKHGVIYDFIKKLKNNPYELEVLGDGRQRKSYISVEDSVEAFLIGLEKTSDAVGVLNIGSEDYVDVTTIARIVIEEMKLSNVELKFTGGVQGRGWPGDVKEMLLDASRIRSLGWRPQHDSGESVRLAARAILAETDMADHTW